MACFFDSKDCIQRYLYVGDQESNGVEFTTEMIAEEKRKGFRYGQVSGPLRKSRGEKDEKLRTVRDGFRHLCNIVKGG